MKITSKEASSTPLHFEISLFSSRFNCETTEKKIMCRLSNSILFAPSKTRVLCNAVNTGKQSDTNSETTQFTHWLTDWLTYSNQLKQHYHSLPRCPSTLFLFSCALWLSIRIIFEAICGFPLCGARRHGTEGSVDSTGPAGIVARWSVLLVSDWARPSAGVQWEKHTTQYPMFLISSVRCAACLCFRGREHVCVCLCELSLCCQNFLPCGCRKWLLGCCTCVLSFLLLKDSL